MLNKKIAALAVAMFLAVSLLCSCLADTQKDVEQSEDTQNATQQEISDKPQVEPDKENSDSSEISDNADSPPEFFQGTEPTEKVKQARAELIEKLSGEYASKGYSVETVSEGVIKVTSPDGQITQHGGNKIVLDSAKHLPEPNFTYYVSCATDNGGELILELEDISPAAATAYANKVQKDGFNRDVMNSLSNDKTELYFHSEAKDGRTLDMTARINHSVDIQLLYNE